MHCKLILQKLCSLSCSSSLTRYLLCHGTTVVDSYTGQSSRIDLLIFLLCTESLESKLACEQFQVVNETRSTTFWTHRCGLVANSQLNEKWYWYLWITIRCFLCVPCSCSSKGLWSIWNAGHVQLNAEWGNTILKMFQNSNNGWNWVSWYRAACRRGLQGTVNSFTHKITPQTELPNSPSTPPQCMQLSNCLI